MVKKVLVIDYDLDTSNLLKRWLEKKSYSVIYTDDQNDVPVLMNKFAPQLVIVDVLQNQVVKKLKGTEHRSVPVLLMTGYTRRPKDYQLPVDDTIEKPFDLPLLEKKIERLIHAAGC